MAQTVCLIIIEAEKAWSRAIIEDIARPLEYI